jgi:hypothetical protein
MKTKIGSLGRMHEKVDNLANSKSNKKDDHYDKEDDVITSRTT